MDNANLTERAEFLASCDDDERAEALEMFRLVDGAADCRCETCPAAGPWMCIGGEND